MGRIQHVNQPHRSHLLWHLLRIGDNCKRCNSPILIIATSLLILSPKPISHRCNAFSAPLKYSNSPLNKNLLLPSPSSLPLSSSSLTDADADPTAPPFINPDTPEQVVQNQLHYFKTGDLEKAYEYHRSISPSLFDRVEDIVNRMQQRDDSNDGTSNENSKIGRGGKDFASFEEFRSYIESEEELKDEGGEDEGVEGGDSIKSLKQFIHYMNRPPLNVILNHERADVLLESYSVEKIHDLGFDNDDDEDDEGDYLGYGYSVESDVMDGDEEDEEVDHERQAAACLVCIRPNRTKNKESETNKDYPVWFWWMLSKHSLDVEGAEDIEWEEGEWKIDGIIPENDDLESEKEFMLMEDSLGAFDGDGEGGYGYDDDDDDESGDDVIFFDFGF